MCVYVNICSFASPQSSKYTFQKQALSSLHNHPVFRPDPAPVPSQKESACVVDVVDIV